MSNWEFIDNSKWSFSGPETSDWVTVHSARNIADGEGFYVDAKGLYHFKYIRDNIFEQDEG
jgi:hypothetical protein